MLKKGQHCNMHSSSPETSNRNHTAMGQAVNRNTLQI